MDTQLKDVLSQPIFALIILVVVILLIILVVVSLYRYESMCDAADTVAYDRTGGNVGGKTTTMWVTGQPGQGQQGENSLGTLSYYRQWGCGAEGVPKEYFTTCRGPYAMSPHRFRKRWVDVRTPSGVNIGDLINESDLENLTPEQARELREYARRHLQKCLNTYKDPQQCSIPLPDYVDTNLAMIGYNP